MPKAPARLTRKQLDAQSQEYEKFKEAWVRYEHFYLGGEDLRRHVTLYLMKRQKEPPEVFLERATRASYRNYLGTIIDWYGAALFRQAPQIQTPSDEFYAEFLADADLCGCSFVEYLRQAFLSALIHRCHWTLVDFPRIEAPAATRAEEDAAGKSRAYVVGYTALDVLDCEYEPAGELLWAKVKRQRIYRQNPFDGEQMAEDCWTIYDREGYAEYRATHKAAAKGDESELVELAAEGPHALSAAKRVPLIGLHLPPGLWLANRAGLPAVEHFNRHNALNWAEHMALFAMPIIFSEREFSQVVGESYYIQLGPNDKFDWTEPRGNTFELARKSLEDNKDEIYRVCYLMTQAGGREARNVGQSGVSKQQDYRVVTEILKAYGEILKDFGARLLGAVAQARQDAGETQITGLDNFDLNELSNEIQYGIELDVMVGASSPTFQRTLRKRLAHKYLDDEPSEVKQKIAKEIDAAPMRIAQNLPEELSARPAARLKALEQDQTGGANARGQETGRKQA